MKTTRTSVWLLASAVLAGAPAASATTAPYFTPLTESAPVVAANAIEEIQAPWVAPEGVSQYNLTSLREVESSLLQTIGRAPDISVPGSGEQDSSAGTSQSMFDMSAFDAMGRYVFIPHESPWSAGLTRYDRWTDFSDLLWRGNGQGANGDWSQDYGAFDPAVWTPNCTVFVAEEWTGEGRLVETLNPYAPVSHIETRDLESIANTAHEGIKFSADGKTIYYIDEWNSGSIYKFVSKKTGDYTVGQTFVLVVDAFSGNPADYYNDPSNVNETRTGKAKWVAITDKDGNPTTAADPFMNGPTNDPRESADTRGGRPAADEVNGTPYGRPEDLEIGRLANGNEVLWVTATSENSVYSIELKSKKKAFVRKFADGNTPKNEGFAPTTGALNSPDNLAQDAAGNIYIIEDAPNGSSTGGDIWFARDLDNDGVAESLDHFLSVRVAGSEATGMIFNPMDPMQFTVNVQHPASTDLDAVPDGFGDAAWEFDIGGSDPRVLTAIRRGHTRQFFENLDTTLKCRAKARMQQGMQARRGRK